jgi:oligosaccharyltransferase complex subunit delta (ribophorin II)
MLLPLCLLLSLALSAAAAAAPRDYFRSADSAAVRAFVGEHAGDAGDFGGVVREARFAALAVRDLTGSNVAAPAPLCALAAAALADASAEPKRLANVLHAAVLAHTLACTAAAPSAASRQLLVDALASTKLADLYAGVVGLRALERAGHGTLPAEPTSLAVRNILALLTDAGLFAAGGGSKSASAFNAGLAFEALADANASAADAKKALAKLAKLLDGAASADAGSLYFNDETSESAHSLANLRATSSVVYGLFKLLRQLGANAPADAVVSAEFAGGVADYLGQHKTVRTLAEAAALARGLHALADLAPKVPLVVSLDAPTTRATAKAPLSVRVTDVLGRAPPAGAVASVTATRFARVGGDGSPIFQNRAAAAAKDAGAFSVPLDSALACGRYTATFDVQVDAKSRYGAVSGAVRTLKSTCKAVPTDVALSINGSPVAKLAYPKQSLDKAHELQAKDALAVSFKVKDADAGQALQVHQAMLRLVHGSSDRDVVVPATLEDGVYTAEFKLTPATLTRIGRQGGEWRVELLIGDQILDEAVVWDAATVDIKVSGPIKPLPGVVVLPPVIDHQFRAPASRPPAVVSLVFTALSLAPFLLLLVLLPRAGFNTNAAPGGATTVTALLFHGLLAAMLVVIGLYWYVFNLVQTLGYLAALALPFVFVGRQLLGQLQLQRVNKAASRQA